VQDRIGYAFLGALLGAVLGVIGWWLYGLAHSMNYSGPGIDPVLRHWLTYTSAGFGLLGFWLKEQVGDLLGDTLNAMFHFELNQSPGRESGHVVSLIFLVILLVVIWFTTPM
jgi:hypothetical protein